ncbi:MAG: Malyl-CoA lyase, partial [uncultured Solirubrobacteraceae bacterium]
AKPSSLLRAAGHRRARSPPRDPLHPLALDPLLRPEQREDGRAGPVHGPDGRHPPRQPRGRDPRRPQGRRPRRPAPGGSRGRSRRHGAVDARQRPGVPLDPQRAHDARHGDRRQARRRDDPQGRGCRGHPLRRPPPRPARGPRRRPAADPRPRDPRDGARRRQRGGDRLRLPAHAGHLARPGGPRGLPAHEDHARRRRAPRLPDDRGPRGRGRAARLLHAGPVALHGRPHGRRLHERRDPPVLRPLRRHQGRRGLRDPVPRRVPARLRRHVDPAPGADRDRQEGLLARPGGGPLRQEGHRGDPGRPRRAHDRRQDAGRRHLEAVPGDGRPRRDARREGPRARRGLRPADRV